MFQLNSPQTTVKAVLLPNHRPMFEFLSFLSLPIFSCFFFKSEGPLAGPECTAFFISFLAFLSIVASV